ncbi:MAG: hypothetical protein QM767_10535 [Anaeromyxobacter sp.]
MTVRTQVVVGLWYALAVVLLGCLVGGWASGEIRGWLAFGFLVSALPCNAAIVVAAAGSREWLNRARQVWLFLAVVELVLFAIAFDPSHPDALRDLDIVLKFTLGPLAFPASILAPLVLAGAGALASMLAGAVGVRAPSGTTEFYLALVGTWAAFVAMGALQWYVVLPAWLRRRDRRRFEASTRMS